MPRVLLCSPRDLRPDLAGTVIGRQGIEMYRASKLADVLLVAKSLGVEVILVDSEFKAAANFIRQLRKEAATRKRSIAVLTHQGVLASGPEFLDAGANGIFRLPPDAGWDERFAKLLSVPVRQQARLEVEIEVETEPECDAAILNLSSGGMFLSTDQALQIGEEFRYRFTLPDMTLVQGKARVARVVAGSGFGVEFIDFDHDAKAAVLAYMRSARLG